MKDPRPLNKKGRPFSWSFSNLQAFENCPASYAASRYYCTAPYVQSEAAKWGDRIHKVPEQAINSQPITEPDLRPHVEPYLEKFLLMRKAGAKVEAEVEIVLDRHMKLLTSRKAWFSKEAWMRVKLDVVVTSGSFSHYFDWKTGKVRDNDDQLRICNAALSIARPELERLSGKFIYTKEKYVSPGVTLTQKNIRDIWADTLPRVQRIEDAWKTETFPARPSGLCPWCSEYNNCAYARG